MSGALYLGLICLYLRYVEEDMEAEMRRLKQELKQTMEMYNLAYKEALSAKQKAEELHHWKREKDHMLDKARKAEEAPMAKTKEAIEAAEAAHRIAEREAQKRINAEMKSLKVAEEKDKAVKFSGVGVTVAIDKDNGSQFALKWAIDHLLSKGQTVTLIHVKQKPSSIPTPICKEKYKNSRCFLDQASTFAENGFILHISFLIGAVGSHVSLSDVHDEVAQTIKKQMDNQAKEIFLPFRAFCTRKGIKTNEIITEDTDVARALCDYVKINLIDTLVVGSPSRNSFIRFKSSVDPTSVSRGSPEFCSVYVISKGKVSSVRSATIAVPTQQNRSHNQISPHPTDVEAEMRRQELKQTMDMYSSSKQKAVELRWKLEEEHSLDEARKAEEAVKTKPTPYGVGGILQGVGLLAFLFYSLLN